MAGRRTRSRKAKRPLGRVRRTWTRSPAQKSHSTKKGLKGYDRPRDKRGIRDELADTES